MKKQKIFNSLEDVSSSDVQIIFEKEIKSISEKLINQPDKIKGFLFNALVGDLIFNIKASDFVHKTLGLLIISSNLGVLQHLIKNGVLPLNELQDYKNEIQNIMDQFELEI